MTESFRSNRRASRIVEVLLLSTVMSVQQRSGEAAYFQQFQSGGVNFCAFPVPLNDPPVKTWPSMPSLNSTGVTRETKECALYCLQSPMCVTYQVVRTGSGVGFCHVVPLLSGVQISDEGTCKSFLMREKKLDCIIRWNPQNFKTRYNKNVFRVERLDKSWSVYNETRGIHILEFDINKCVPAKHSIFDTKLGTSERNKFQNYLDKSVSMGTYLIGFSVNDFLDNSMILFLSRYFRISYDFSQTSSLAFMCQKLTFFNCFYQEDKWIDLGFTIFIGISVDKPMVPIHDVKWLFTQYYENFEPTN